MITLIGSEGSMGKRYQSILRFKREPMECFDKESIMDDIVSSASRSKGVILATPTNTHGTYLRELIPVARKILCEKPIVKDTEELIELYRLAREHSTELMMMLQYAELIDPSRHAWPSYYDYFRTGPDGLPWDALQIIGFAKGECKIENSSPVWRCMINGHNLNIADMDSAYIRAVMKWINGELKQDPESIIQMHMKTRDFGKEIYESAD